MKRKAHGGRKYLQSMYLTTDMSKNIRNSQNGIKRKQTNREKNELKI
jgi:hypothetical protein